ncbi:unnamed protein product, partial [Mesorhabditis belari]|uniref:6-phosphogluconolactonase n=1 Tax=Mesorhabditis belari TaxID=2138241 RepID=A0AAF3J7M9_9BILA
MNRENVFIGETAENYNDMLKIYLEEVLRKELQVNGIVSIGVSGGSMPKLIVPILLSMEGLNWKKIRLFMVDERYASLDHPDSNAGQYIKLLPPALKENVVAVDMLDSLSKTASQYDAKLRNELQPEMIGIRGPRFDLLLLGMGPDGHTASLFPSSRLWKLPEMTVMHVEDSPKPPSRRVTLSITAINNAKNVAFLITGEEKADILKSILDGEQSYPAALVKPLSGRLKFFLDKAAASKL